MSEAPLPASSFVRLYATALVSAEAEIESLYRTLVDRERFAHAAG